MQNPELQKKISLQVIYVIYVLQITTRFSPLLFWPQGEVYLSTPRCYSIHSVSAFPQSFSTVREAGFEPGTTASVVSILERQVTQHGILHTADSDSAVSVPSPCLTTPSFNSSWRPLLYDRLFSQSAFYMRKVYWTCTRVALSEVVRKSVLWHGKMEKGKNGFLIRTTF